MGIVDYGKSVMYCIDYSVHVSNTVSLADNKNDQYLTERILNAIFPFKVFNDILLKNNKPVSKAPFYCKSAPTQAIAWHQLGEKPSSGSGNAPLYQTTQS